MRTAVLLIAAAMAAQSATIVSLSGPDGPGGELVSSSRFAAFSWVSEDAHFGVSVWARLAVF